MAIRDLLWACPFCRAEDAIRTEGRGEVCKRCGARFRRGAGAEIEARPVGGQPVRRHAAEWAAELPPVRLPDETEAGPDEREYRRTAAVARFVVGLAPVHARGRYLGRVERLGPAVQGTLVLTSRALTFAPGEGQAHRWPLEAVAAVQPSSSGLQLRMRGGPVVLFRFPDASVRLWEETIQAALRRLYRRAGWGEIVEFQPRISVR
ncbi:MAG: hypothetical protein DIU52_002815 [bacterium]|jgi:hypothetical protein